MKSAANFFKKLREADIPAIALENPKMHPEALAAIGGTRPSQTIHPHMYACEVTKPTNLYLLGLPLLKPSHVIPRQMRMHSISALPPSPLRAMIKGRTFDGIARAMAQQWLPAIAAARLHQEESRVSIAVRHRLDLTYGQEGVLNGPRPDWSAVGHFQRESTVIAAVMETSSRGHPEPGSLRRGWCTVAANRTQQPEPEPPMREKIFAAWKRQAELNRGSIFRIAHRRTSPLTRQLSTPEEKPSGKLVMRVARVGPKRARCLNWKGTSFHVVLELEHVEPVDKRSATRKADAVSPAFARAGQRHDTLKRVAQRGRCRLLFLVGVKHVVISSDCVEALVR